MKKGFTLIELMVVISIIGLLSSIILASLKTATEKAKIARAKTEMRQLRDILVVAQGESGGALLERTSNPFFNYQDNRTFCIYCSCGISPPIPMDLRNISSASQCYLDWKYALDRISLTSKGIYGNISVLDRDPWGSPYQLDLNEHEGNTWNPCRPDMLASAGPNGRIETLVPALPLVADNKYHMTFSGDDFGLLLPNADTSCPGWVMD